MGLVLYCVINVHIPNVVRYYHECQVQISVKCGPFRILSNHSYGFISHSFINGHRPFLRNLLWKSYFHLVLVRYVTSFMSLEIFSTQYDRYRHLGILTYEIFRSIPTLNNYFSQERTSTKSMNKIRYKI